MMAETYGRVVVQATPAVITAFTQHRDEGLEKLVEYSSADSSINDDCDVFFEELQIKGDSGCFEFVDMYWSQTVKRLGATGKGIGLYLHAWSEYGSHYFYAKNPQGQHFSFFAGGPDDDADIEGGDVVTDANLQAWLAIIPEEIKASFPQLVTEIDQ